ncbi:MAG: hypothetical protein Q7I97_00245 [Thermovirgaceae bacterium]|nr:hypothetical protein [Thermovirgaceae bacterium]
MSGVLTAALEAVSKLDKAGLAISDGPCLRTGLQPVRRVGSPPG